MTRPRSGRSATFRLRVTPRELAALHRRGEAEGGYDWARAALLGDEVEVVEVGPGRPPRPKDAVRIGEVWHVVTRRGVVCGVEVPDDAETAAMEDTARRNRCPICLSFRGTFDVPVTAETLARRSD